MQYYLLDINDITFSSISLILLACIIWSISHHNCNYRTTAKCCMGSCCAVIFSLFVVLWYTRRPTRWHSTWNWHPLNCFITNVIKLLRRGGLCSQRKVSFYGIIRALYNRMRRTAFVHRNDNTPVIYLIALWDYEIYFVFTSTWVL